MQANMQAILSLNAGIWADIGGPVIDIIAVGPVSLPN